MTSSVLIYWKLHSSHPFGFRGEMSTAGPGWGESMGNMSTHIWTWPCKHNNHSLTWRHHVCSHNLKTLLSAGRAQRHWHAVDLELNVCTITSNSTFSICRSALGKNGIILYWYKLMFYQVHNFSLILNIPTNENRNICFVIAMTKSLQEFCKNHWSGQPSPAHRPWWKSAKCNSEDGW